METAGVLWKVGVHVVGVYMHVSLCVCVYVDGDTS